MALMRCSNSAMVFLAPVKGEAGKIGLVKGEHYCHSILLTKTIRKRTESISLTIVRMIQSSVN